MYTASYGGDWQGCIEQFLDAYADPLEAFGFYTRALGKF
jgi:hypothetical protein